MENCIVFGSAHEGNLERVIRYVFEGSRFGKLLDRL
jgi:hypothetical protein